MTPQNQITLTNHIKYPNLPEKILEMIIFLCLKRVNLTFKTNPLLLKTIIIMTRK